MKDYVPMLIVGLMVIVLSIPNLMGRVASVERCRRQGISERYMPAYSRIAGLGTLVIGVSIALTAALMMLLQVKALYIIAAVGCLAGVGVIMYGQAKYRGRGL